jgi:hypothetical protein
MGAAAVFETAAEIPPTIDKRLVAVSTGKKIVQVVSIEVKGQLHPYSMEIVLRGKTYSRNRPRSPAHTLAKVR